MAQVCVGLHICRHRTKNRLAELYSYLYLRGSFTKHYGKVRATFLLVLHLLVTFAHKLSYVSTLSFENVISIRRYACETNVCFSPRYIEKNVFLVESRDESKVVQDEMFALKTKK